MAQSLVTEAKGREKQAQLLTSLPGVLFGVACFCCPVLRAQAPGLGSHIERSKIRTYIIAQGSAKPLCSFSFHPSKACDGGSHCQILFFHYMRLFQSRAVQRYRRRSSSDHGTLAALNPRSSSAIGLWTTQIQTPFPMLVESPQPCTS